jgi:hypothetical protein
VSHESVDCSRSPASLLLLSICSMFLNLIWREVISEWREVPIGRVNTVFRWIFCEENERRNSHDCFSHKPAQGHGNVQPTVAAAAPQGSLSADGDYQLVQYAVLFPLYNQYEAESSSLAVIPWGR